jgi:CHAD domain-containing protein
MAKARDIDGLHADMRFAEAAAATVTVRAEELFEHAEGVLDMTDIERVHDMRVASRRLRAVLEIFEPCFPRAPFNSVLTDVKALADALGERRDPDVHLAQLEEFAGAVKEADRPGVEVFAERVRAEQGAGNQALAAALAEIQDSDLRGRLAALAASAAPDGPPRRDVDGPAQDAGPDAPSEVTP